MRKILLRLVLYTLFYILFRIWVDDRFYIDYE